MDAPLMSNNFVITIYKKLPQIRPDIIITNIKKIIKHAWFLRLRNGADIPMSSNFSIRTNIWRVRNGNKRIYFDNFTEDVKIPMYKRVYSYRAGFIQTPYVISKLYMCDQVELEPSEFALSTSKDVMYSYTTKRFMFDGQFTLVQSQDGRYRARICIEDSGMYMLNRATTFMYKIEQFYNPLLSILVLKICC